jgi:hypothetical protein
MHFSKSKEKYFALTAVLQAILQETVPVKRIKNRIKRQPGPWPLIVKNFTFAQSQKIYRKLNVELVEMAINSCSDQIYVRTELINRTEIDHKNKITALCYYENKHPCSSACFRIEIAKKDGRVQRKTIKVGLVTTLEVYVLVGGDFGDIRYLLSLNATSLKVGNAEVAK